MDWTILLNLIAVVLLIGANGFFVSCEFSLVSMRASRIEELCNEGHPVAPQLQRAHEHLDAYLAATQIGITIASLALGWVGEPAVAGLLTSGFAWVGLPLDPVIGHTIAVVIAFTLVTFLHVVFGELVPKSIAIQKTEAVALTVTRPLRFFLWLFRPLLVILNGFANWTLHRLGLSADMDEGHFYSPQELRLLIGASSQAGLIENTQGELVDRALTIGERNIAAYMTPDEDLDWLDATTPVAQLQAHVMASRFSRFPVRGPGEDDIGIVSAKAILSQPSTLKTLPPEAISRPVYVPDTAEALQVMEAFRHDHLDCVLVVDEYGDLRGMVTTHDLFDALAGGRRSDPAPVLEGQDTPETWDIDAGMSIDEFRRLTKHPSIGQAGQHWYNTVAGFALERLGQLPHIDDRFTDGDLEFEIAEMDGMRIKRITVRSLSPLPSPEAAAAAPVV